MTLLTARRHASSHGMLCWLGDFSGLARQTVASCHCSRPDVPTLTNCHKMPYSSLFSLLQPKFCFSESPSQPLAAAHRGSVAVVRGCVHHPNGNIAGLMAAAAAAAAACVGAVEDGVASTLRQARGPKRFTRMRAVRGLVSRSLIALSLECRPLTSHGRLAQRNQPTKKPTMP